MKGSVTCRQRILEITTIGEGKASRCEIKLDSQVIRTAPLARRAVSGLALFREGRAAGPVGGRADGPAA
jgi:hypothetical protein